MESAPRPQCVGKAGAGRALQIVTGAQNVRPGEMAPVCLDGARLPDGKAIKSGKLRGVASEGMLCSLSELGLTLHDFPYAEEDGIFLMREECAPGDDIRDVLRLRDTLVEFELTFNRPDCLSYIGIAREAAATFGGPLRLPEPSVQARGDGDRIENYISVRVENPVLCPRYSAGVVKNVKIAPSPLWLRARLRAAGVRPINNIVDITNYVMLEYGQPMHAFDYGYIGSKQIIVRNAAAGETIRTLDGAARAMTPEMLCIADGGKPVALAGIMGGANSEILETTGTVVFESASFNRESIRRTSRAVGLRTESSARYEKGLPACNTMPALERALELVTQLGAGEVVDGRIDVCAADLSPRRVRFDWEGINALLGTALTREEMLALLRPLELLDDGEGGLSVPAWRPDIVLTADVAEEVARLYGYGNIEATLFSGTATEGGEPPYERFLAQASEIAAGLGFHEICTTSFAAAKQLDELGLPGESAYRNGIRLRNPLGDDTALLRTHPLPGVLEALARNQNQRAKGCALFEHMTLYYAADGGAREEKTLCLGCYGSGDFYDVKGRVETLCGALGIESLVFEAEREEACFHPGRCARVRAGETAIGLVGQVHPEVCASYGLEAEVYAALLDDGALFGAVRTERRYEALPVYPAMERDLALVCDEALEAGTLCGYIRSYAGKALREASVFDVYRGKGIEPGKKSVAVRLTFRLEDRTMTDEEADAAVKKILKKLASEQGVALRG